MLNFYKQTESGESKTIKFPFNFLRLPPAPPAVFLRIRKFLVLRRAEDERRQAECVLCAHGVCRSEDGATPRRGGIGITTRSARKMKFEATTRSARGLFVKILRILFVQCSNFVQKTPPIFTFARMSKNGSVAKRRPTFCRFGQK